MFDHRQHEHHDRAARGARSARPAPRTPVGLASGRAEVVGRQGLLDLQRSAGNAATAQLLAAPAEGPTAPPTQRSPVLDVLSAAGSPLDERVRTEMEARMGQDFSDVRVHTDSAASASAKSVQAHAYTVGADIVFGSGAYDPVSNSGRTLLAHELTHVVQQRSGPVSGTAAGGGIKVSDPSDRFEREAESNARSVMTRPAP